MTPRALSIFAAVLVLASRPAAALTPEREAFLRDTRDYLGMLERLGFSGAVLVAERGEILLAEGYSLANREAKIRWTPETVSTVGSITKQFTAAAIMALAEEGKLRLEDSIAGYFPNVPPDKAGITLHHLLTHTSGIVDAFPHGDFDPVDRDLMLKLAMEAPLATPPGEHYEYSNAGFSLLGMIIERVSGKPYETYLKERLFDRAGMHDTGYRVGWDSARVAQGYRGSECWGTILEKPWDKDGPYWILRANGGIHSTCRDMLRWAEALLDDRVLRPETRRKMWSPYADEGGGQSFYAYGWVVMTGPDGKSVVTHNGGNGIFFADYALSPETGVVIYLMTNVVAEFPRANGLLTELGARLAAGTPYPRVPKVVTVPEDSLKEYEGNYGLSSGGRIEVRIAGDRLEFLPQGKDAWNVLYRPAEDASALAEKHAVLDRVVGAFLQGDYMPMHAAYGDRVPLATLMERGRSSLAEFEKELGPVTGYEILGSAPLPDGTATYVKLQGERGARYRQYIWNPEEGLLGYRPLEAMDLPAFFPVGPDRFQAWGGRLAVDAAARFEQDPSGGRWLVLGDEASPTRLPAALDPTPSSR